MIEAKDLRIGNKILFGKLLIEETVYQITFDRREGYLINGSIPPEHCEGISLTPDILLACGFNKIQEGTMAHPEVWRIPYRHRLVSVMFDIHTREQGEYTFIQGNLIVELQYLHQLQNLFFALTGLEISYKPV